MKITENFDSQEFACRCGCGFDDINPSLVHRLQVVRDIAGCRIVILSGCRCSKHNAAVGGTPESYHLVGQAADWRFIHFIGRRMNLEHILTETSKLTWDWSGGYHFYSELGFIHTDIGPRRRW